MKAALDILTTAPEFDLILCVVGSSARFYPELAVRPIVDSAGAGKPIAAYLVPEAPQALAMLSHAGVPNFRTPEACADAIAAALRRRAPVPVTSWPGIARRKTRVNALMSRPSTSCTSATRQDVDARHRAGHDGGGGRLIDELAAYDLLAKYGLTCAPSLPLDADLTTA